MSIEDILDDIFYHMRDLMRDDVSSWQENRVRGEIRKMLVTLDDDARTQAYECGYDEAKLEYDCE